MDERQEQGNGTETEQGESTQPEQSSEPLTTLAVEEQEPHAPAKKRALSRRQFLVLSAVTGGVAGASLLIGFTVFNKQGQGKPGTTGKKPAAAFTPNVWVQIDANNTVTIWLGKSEMGQGVMTALPMLLAEELDADWSTVRVELAPADERYGDQLTDGSSSVNASYSGLRGAGAQARALLVAAAAQTWGVEQSTCRTEKGVVIHIPTGKRLVYGDLAGVASTLPLNPTTLASLKLKQPDQFTLIGTRVPRLDTPQKVDGSATFGLDIRRPGMRYATIARCPFLGGTLESFDSSKASAVPGVIQVVQVKSGVAVVAENTWAAIQGRAALNVTWNPGPNANLTSAQIRDQLEASVQKLVSAGGNAPAATTGKTLEATYETPYMPHAPLEPMNCTADVQSARCEVWAPTQHPQAAQQVAATESGLLTKDVTLHVTLMGGGFGRRAQTDFVAEAVQVSKAIGAPVQVVWTRDDDLKYDFYRPASYQHLSATLNAQGLPIAWSHSVAIPTSDGQTATDGADVPYNIPSISVTGSEINSAVRTGIWRSFNYSNAIFARESFLDEVAAASGLDPYQLRVSLLSDNPSFLALVQLAASKAGWGTPLPAGWGRGIAFCSFSAKTSSTAVAEVAEVSVEADGTARVQRVVCAVSCGLVVNPTIAESQIEGAIVEGLTVALNGQITVANGQIQQQNFHDYPLLRMNEMPTIEVYFLPSTDKPTGLGEPALPPIAPAVANAIFAATGRRIRRLPMQPAAQR
ncbi:MAG TPA: molybdopterin cofactor-binding domain-containing protein [Ktedonobacterales bacterium]